ncbi:unnamed protein product [Strongylus vulgaris]|uniref:Uncharacterized protein n=1 Tax=Strongylus vulgaris TaxID=40348 RepID=A0A3P7KCK1_STRVU|nr:unnamed protein product [Strongylus vulgaris]
MPKVAEERCGHDSQLEKIPTVMVEQMRLQQEEMKMQHDEMKSMFATHSRNQGGTVQDASKDQYDQLSRDVQKFSQTKRQVTHSPIASTGTDRLYATLCCRAIRSAI